MTTTLPAFIEATFRNDGGFGEAVTLFNRDYPGVKIVCELPRRQFQPPNEQVFEVEFEGNTYHVTTDRYGWGDTAVLLP